MSKGKMVEDPGDEARLRKMGPQPPTADSPLSGEKETAIDEVHHVTVERDTNDVGVPRVNVTPLRASDGPGQAKSHTPTPMDYIRRQAEAHEERMAKATAEVVPGVEYRKAQPTCAKFVSRNGRGEWVGAVCWCQKDCVSLVDGACGEGHRQLVQMFVRRVQPATMAEYEKMVSEEGASQAADTGARVAAAAAEIANKAVAEKKAAEAEQLERDRQIMEARQEERLRPKIEAMSTETAAARRQAEWNSARMR
jgi:hypothetical protein